MKVGQWLGEGPSRIALYGRRHMEGLGIQTKKLYMIIRSTPYAVLDLQNGFGVVHEKNCNNISGQYYTE